jgi:hypothetical protein
LLLVLGHERGLVVGLFSLASVRIASFVLLLLLLVESGSGSNQSERNMANKGNIYGLAFGLSEIID